MKSKTVSSHPAKRTHNGSFVFWFLTICHYFFGIAGMTAAALTATNIVSQELTGFIAVGCIAIFAFTKPDLKYKRLVTGWRFLDKKLTNKESY
ncbi:MAG: hypothetical protein V4450_03300 [Bacteroidota bacterium]